MKFNILLIVIMYSIIVLQSKAQYPTQWVVEMQYGINDNKNDVTEDQSLIKSPTRGVYRIGVGKIYQPSRRINYKIMAGWMYSPQQLDFQYQESFSKQLKTFSIKYNESYAFLKMGANTVWYVNKRQHVEFGISANFNYNLNVFQNSNTYLKFENYIDPISGENIAALNSSVVMNQGSDLKNGYVLILAGLNFVYSFDNLLGKGKNLRVGVEVNRFANLSDKADNSTNITYSTFYSDKNHRTLLEKVRFHDNHNSASLIIGIGF